MNLLVVDDEFSLSTQSHTALPSAALSVQTDSDEFMEKIRAFIIDNLHSPELNRNMIAEHVHMNPDYLSTLFRAKFNQTLVSYITSARIDHAKELMATTSLSLNEISERTGFSTSSYFHKQFKKSTGMTPSQYAARKQL